MTNRGDGHSSSNPFSTRFIRPGAIPYWYPAGRCTNDLIAELAKSHWRGQIIGPHGSGKSTLLASLIEPLQRQGRASSTICLRDGQRRPPTDWTGRAERAGARLIIVDGYEQLGYGSRFWLKMVCRRRGWGLLVTAHHDVGLPTLIRVAASVQTAQAVVERLLPQGNTVISSQKIAESFAAAHGDMREMLFALYDEYENSTESG